VRAAFAAPGLFFRLKPWLFPLSLATRNWRRFFSNRVTPRPRFERLPLFSAYATVAYAAFVVRVTPRAVIVDQDRLSATAERTLGVENEIH
jgi:hypothetical protein